MEAILNYPAVASLGPWLDHCAKFLNDLPAQIALPVLLSPIILALLSRRIFVFFSSALLVLVAFALLAWPAQIHITLALATYLGSLIAACLGIAASRTNRAIQLQLGELRQNVSQLQASESRRYMLDITESKPTKEPKE